MSANANSCAAAVSVGCCSHLVPATLKLVFSGGSCAPVTGQTLTLIHDGTDWASTTAAGCANCSSPLHLSCQSGVWNLANGDQLWSAPMSPSSSQCPDASNGYQFQLVFSVTFNSPCGCCNGSTFTVTITGALVDNSADSNCGCGAVASLNPPSFGGSGEIPAVTPPEPPPSGPPGIPVSPTLPPAPCGCGCPTCQGNAAMDTVCPAAAVPAQLESQFTPPVP